MSGKSTVCRVDAISEGSTSMPSPTRVRTRRRSSCQGIRRTCGAARSYYASSTRSIRSDRYRSINRRINEYGMRRLGVNNQGDRLGSRLIHGDREYRRRGNLMTKINVPYPSIRISVTEIDMHVCTLHITSGLAAVSGLTYG